MMTYFYFIIITTIKLRRYKSFNDTNPLNFPFVQMFTSQYSGLVFLLFLATERMEDFWLKYVLLGLPFLPQWRPSFLSGVSWDICMNKSIMYLEVQHYFMKHSECFPLLQHSPQLKTTSSTNLSLLPQLHFLLLHHTKPSIPSHPQTILSPGYLSQLLSTLKISVCQLPFLP